MSIKKYPLKVSSEPSLEGTFWLLFKLWLKEAMDNLCSCGGMLPYFDEDSKLFRSLSWESSTPCVHEVIVKILLKNATLKFIKMLIKRLIKWVFPDKKLFNFCYGGLILFLRGNVNIERWNFEGVDLNSLPCKPYQGKNVGKK